MNQVVKIEVTPTISRLRTRIPAHIIDILDTECSFYQPGAEFVIVNTGIQWDGFRHLFNKKTATFPTGLLRRVCSILQNNGYYVEIERKYPKIHKINIGNLAINLFDYQKECLQKIVEEERGLIKLPTGSGKGCIISATVVSKQVPTIIIVHRQDLLYQMQTRLKKEANIDAGLVGAGQVDFKDVTVAMLQTLCRNLGIKEKLSEEDNTIVSNIKKELLRFNMLISDEVHIAGAPNYFKLSKAFKNAVYRYGFSATPLYRDEALLIEAMFGPILYEKNIVDMCGKYIADAKIVFVPFKHSPVPKYLTYEDIYRDNIVFNDKRNKFIVDLAQKYKDRKVMIATRRVDHGHELARLLPGAVFVHGKIPPEQRQEILKDFQEGSLNCVIMTCVWEQGIDIPKAEVLIDVRAEKSKIAFIQLIGRVLRKTHDKDKALIIDIADSGCRYLTEHTKERINIAISEFGVTSVFKLKKEVEE